MAAQLAQVVDPEALDACDGTRAKLALNVDRTWMQEGATLRVAVPKRLPCARCDGGGCDGCDRSGVLRGPDAVQARTLTVELPGDQPGGATVVLRLTKPFADDTIAQLLIHLSPANAPDPRITKVTRSAALASSTEGGPRPLVVAALVAVAALLGWLAANGF